MKVGIISEKYYPYVSGGAERSLQILAEGLAGSGIEPVVISLRPDPGRGVEHVNGVKVHYVGLENFYWPFDGKSRSPLTHYLFHARSALSAAMAGKVGALLDEERPDLAHTNNLAGFGVQTWRAAKSRRIPIVHTLRDYYLMCPFSSMFRRGKNCEAACARCVPFRAAFRRASRTVDGVAGNSRFILQRHVSAGFFKAAPQRKVIYNASGTGVSPGARPNPGKVVTFGFLGRIVPEKGLELILESLTSLDLSNWRIDMAGSGDERYHAYLEDRFRDERIRWLGWTEPNAVYQSVDYVVLPSLWHEPLSRTVLEAFSHGVPVIASRRGGNTELVREDVNGFLFDPERPESLAAVLRKALRCNVRLPELSRACLQDAQSFTEDRLVHEYASLYAAVCRTKSLLPSVG